jgi:hypothetical protein
MALSPPKVQWRSSSLRIEIQTSRNPCESSARPASAREDGIPLRAMETRVARWALHPTMLPWIGWGFPVRTPGNDKQASSVLTCGGPTRPKKPVRRCFKSRPPLRAGYAGFASGCRLGVSRTRSFSGGCPASCPDAHQPARDHRHVRNWASSEIGAIASDHKTFLAFPGDFFATHPSLAPAPALFSFY